jgi:hypothetical protein
MDDAGISKIIKRKKHSCYTSGKNTVPVVFCAIPSMSSAAALLEIALTSSQGSNFVPMKCASTTVIYINNNIKITKQIMIPVNEKAIKTELAQDMHV